jgi:hypothetical protein
MGCKECAFCGSPDSKFECARCDVRYCGRECSDSKPNSVEKDKERKDNGEIALLVAPAIQCQSASAHLCIIAMRLAGRSMKRHT